jgi:SAM-dependent methyltransferase
LASQFARPSGLGGAVVTRVMNRQNRRLYDQAVKLLEVADADAVLDIGCGNGFVLNRLAKTSRAALVGVDPSASMVRAAAARNRRFVDGGRMAVMAGEVSHVPLPNGSVTKALSINTVYFWDDVPAAMAEIRRLLRAGGLFVNALYTNAALDRHPHTRIGYARHRPKDLAAAAERAGFAVATIPVLDGAAYCQACQAR